MINIKTNLIGAITELRCKTYFLEREYTVSTPEYPARYDFILDTGNDLFKIQVKTCKLENGALVFPTCSSHFINGKVTHTDYSNDGIDYICTWYDEKCYLVPVSECGKSTKSLRLDPLSYGRMKGVCFAKNYIADEVLKQKALLV